MTITHNTFGNRIAFVAIDEPKTPLDSRKENPGVKKANWLERLFGKWFTTKLSIDGKIYEVNKKSLRQYLVRTSKKSPSKDAPTEKVHKAAMSAFEKASKAQRTAQTALYRGNLLMHHFTMHAARLVERGDVVEYTSASLDQADTSYESQERWNLFFEKEIDHSTEIRRAWTVVGSRDSQQLTPNAQFERAFHSFATLHTPSIGTPNHLINRDSQQIIFAYIKSLPSLLKAELTGQMKEIQTILNATDGYMLDFEKSKKLEDLRQKLEVEIKQHPAKKAEYEHKFKVFNQIEWQLATHRDLSATIANLKEMGKDAHNTIQQLQAIDPALISEITDEVLRESLENYNASLNGYKETFDHAHTTTADHPFAIQMEKHRIEDLEQKVKIFREMLGLESSIEINADGYDAENLSDLSIRVLEKFQAIFTTIKEDLQSDIQTPLENSEMDDLKGKLAQLIERRQIISGKPGSALDRTLLQVKASKLTPRFIKKLIKTDIPQRLSKVTKDLEEQVAVLLEEHKQLSPDHPTWNQKQTYILNLQQQISDYTTAYKSADGKEGELLQINVAIDQKEKELKDLKLQRKESILSTERALLETNKKLQALQKILKPKIATFNALALENAKVHGISLKEAPLRTEIIQMLNVTRDTSLLKISALKKAFSDAIQMEKFEWPRLVERQAKVALQTELLKPLPLNKTATELEGRLKETQIEIDALAQKKATDLPLLNKKLQDINLKDKGALHLYHYAKAAEIMYRHYFNWILSKSTLDATHEIQQAKLALDSLDKRFLKVDLKFTVDPSLISKEIRNLILTSDPRNPPTPSFEADAGSRLSSIYLHRQETVKA